MTTYWLKTDFFPTPLSFKALARGEAFRILDELFIVKTRARGLSLGEDFVILACVILTQCQYVTDGQTDRQTDRQTDNPTVGNTGLCIASYADAL